jgi:hypothetical protein
LGGSGERLAAHVKQIGIRRWPAIENIAAAT